MRAGLLASLLLWTAGPVRAADDDPLRKKALDLNSVTGDTAIAGKILDLARDPAGTKQLLAVAAKMIKEKDQPFNVNATRILARVAHRVRDFDDGLTFYRVHIVQVKQLGSGEKIIVAYDNLLQLLIDARKYDEAEKTCKEILDIETDDETILDYKPLVQRRFILINVKQGKGDDALKRVDTLLKAQPDNWLNLELKGDVYRTMGKYDEAAKVYQDVIAAIEKDERFPEDKRKLFANDTRYTMSGLYIDANKVDKAVEVLRGLVKGDPDNPTYNNDLGYIMADNNMNLDEAEKLIRKALEDDRKQRKANPKIKPEDDKDNPGYVDSLGWVLYKKKNYKEAKEELKKALEQPDGQHLEIYDHFGDACLALGQKAEAVAAWKKAVEVAADTKRELAKKVLIEKKIKDNQ